jgi:4-oxalomesaconate hydratase
MSSGSDGQGATVLVVSAHAADFVWRAGGYIACATDAGDAVHVVCLSFGERGESQRLWRQPDMTLEQVKKVRREEANQAAQVLGAAIEFLDAGDYPLPDSPDLIHRLARLMRRLQPTVVLTHSVTDPYNPDHGLAADLTIRARAVAQAAGYRYDEPTLGAPPVFRYEPHQPEMCLFRPDVFVDITEAFPRKRAAMECMQAQEHLWDYYTDLARRRGVQAVRNGGPRTIRYAEAYQRVFPQVTGELA